MKRIVAIILLVASSCAFASEWSDSANIEQLFVDAGVSGTFVLYDVTEDKFVGFNPIRAKTRFIPASTFKIPHTLIGLAEGVVKSVDEVLPYGGKPQPFSSWEKDMSLRDALPISNVPIYQGLARRVKRDRMAANVTLINYGNNDIGRVVDNFWLAGPLKISAMEQASFLATLAQNKLPYPSEIQKQVREITLLKKGEEWSLHGKTGLTDTPDPDIGWWVGWVVQQEKIYSFALNIDILHASDANKRVQLGRDSLSALGLLQEPF